jgi:hypothetical protein
MSNMYMFRRAQLENLHISRICRDPIALVVWFAEAATQDIASMIHCQQRTLRITPVVGVRYRIIRYWSRRTDDAAMPALSKLFAHRGGFF